jgi:hypothetical protein
MFNSCDGPGIDVGSLLPGTEMIVDTRNSRYRLVILEGTVGAAQVMGGRYFPQETTARIEGSTLRGSPLKIGWVGRGLCLELSAGGKRIVTSRVRSIRLASVHDIHTKD